MKKEKVIYWTSTGIVSAMMLFAMYSYLTQETMNVAFTHLGFPAYFRIELGMAKGLGVIALIMPMVSKRLKEFAYFGFAITFISAFIAHLSSGDEFYIAINPLIFLVILFVSYVYFNKINKQIE